MSSSFVADNSEQKQEGSVVIVLNEDGTVSLDEQTLQKLLAAKNLQQQVSVVRMNQSGEGGEMMSTPITLDDVVVSEEGQPEVNLTVENFFPNATPTDATPSSSEPINPFMQMDPEQLEKLENALQSEQAKQILGEGVSAMLDMLTSKDDKTEEPSKKATSIQLDHCYTGSSRTGRVVDESAEETESDEEELERKRRSQRGRGRGARGGKTAPTASPAKSRTPPTRKSTRAQPVAPAPPPESTPPANLTKLGQSPAKTLLRTTTAKTSPIKKEPLVAPERKTYPQRTNRKPPAHLADAYGPGLMTSPETPKKSVEVVKKEPIMDIVPKVEDMPSFSMDIMPIGSAQALLEPEAIEELQAVLGDLGPEVLKPLEEAKAEMDEALLEEAEEEKIKAQAIAARRRSSSSKASVNDDDAGKGGRPARKAGLSKVTSDAIREIQAASDEEEASADEDGDEEWDSEDDPDKLWCICQKPHNNRFMICCDKCEDWFHGKCVGITKAMGKQMEAQGKEWTCPKCKKLLAPNETPAKTNESSEKTGLEAGSPAKARRSSSTSSTSTPAVPKKSPKAPPVVKSAEKPQSTQNLASKRPEAKKLTPLVIDHSAHASQQAATPVKKVSCIVCKKPARTSSIYCSDDCILVHAQDSLNLLKKDKVLTPVTPKPNDPSKSLTPESAPADTSENRVLMYEQRSGKILAGTHAPTESTLNTWLKEHPTFQVCKPNLVANIREKLKRLTGDKQQIYIKPQHPKPEPKVIPVLGLPMKTPKTPQTPAGRSIIIPSQRLPSAGHSPSPSKTVLKADAKGATPSTPAAGTKQLTVKTVTKTPSPGLKTIAPKQPSKEQSSSSTSKAEQAPAKKQTSVEATRLSVRNSLQEVFKARMDECKDLKVSENELKGIATSIEEELFAYFKDTGAKYKAKFRSIHFNVKDPKNLTLFKKIGSGEYSPHQLVRLSSEDLASKELAAWREQEEKHQIEMIKKTEMDLLHQNVTYIKTHKGEQMIETDDSLKLQTDAVEAETAAEPVPDSSTAEGSEEVPSMRPPSSTSSSKDKDRSNHSRHHHHHKTSKSSRHHDSKKHSSSHKSSSHSKDKSQPKDSKDSSKEKDLKIKSDSHSKSSSSSSSRRHSRHSSSEHKSRESEEKSSRSSSSLSKSSDSKSINKDKVAAPVVEELSESAKEIMEKLEKIKSSTPTPAVILPEEETLSDREPSSTVNIKTPESVIEDSISSIWKGLVTTQDVSNFSIAISEVSGSAPTFNTDFPKVCDIVGRIAADTVWDYITKVKKVGTKDIMVVKLIATSPDDKHNYIAYYNYLLSRNRFGVVGKKGPKLKDFYIFPLPSKSPVPQVLLPFDGPGLEDGRPNLLLGVIVQMHRKRPADSGGTAGPSKVSKSSSKSEERSYTPPLPEASSKSTHRSHTPPVTSNIIEPYSPTQTSKSKVTPTEDDEPYSPTGGLNSPEESEPLSSELEELNRKIEEEKLRIETISSELVCTKGKGPFGEPVQVASFLSSITSDVVSSKLTAIPGLSETIVESSGATLQGSVAMDKQDDENEAYSPSRSFTPPPPQGQSIPFLRDTSTISLPSNLQEILASIQKRPSVPEVLSMGLSLDCDPIVREYADETLEEPGTPPLDAATKAMMEIEQFEDDVNHYLKDAGTSEVKPPKHRDPRQKQASKPEKQSALSKLSEEELIAKANEMLMAQEMSVPAAVPAAMPFVPPPQTSFPPPLHLPPPMPPMVPPVFDIPPPPPGTDFKDQDMRQMQQQPHHERKGISFKVTKKPNLPRWDRKRQDDWDTDGSGASYSKRSRLSPPPRRKSRDSN